MEYYLLCLILSIIVNSLPFGGPSTWMVLTFFIWKFDLNIPIIILLGLIGSTIGRYLLAKLFHTLFSKFKFNQVDQNIDFFSALIAQNKSKILLFTTIYCVLPTPTNWLFIPAGKESRGLNLILLGHLVGRIINYTYSVLVALKTISIINDIIKGDIFSLNNILLQLGLIIISVSLLFIDWHVLLIERKIKFNFARNK